MESLIDQVSKWDVTDFVGVIALVAVIGGLLIGAIGVVTEFFRNRARDEMDATIKMEMLERGMSAEDIVKVLNANSADAIAKLSLENGGHGCRSSRRAMRRAMREAAREHGHA